MLEAPSYSTVSPTFLITYRDPHPSDATSFAVACAVTFNSRPDLLESANGATIAPMCSGRLIATSCLSVTFLAACGDGSDTPKCIPGASVECACPTGQQGAQTCSPAGTFTPCVCATPALDAGVLGGAGGTSVPPTSSGTGGQGSGGLDAGVLGGAGGTSGPPVSGGTGGQGTGGTDGGAGGTGGVSTQTTVVVVDASGVGAETAGEVSTADTPLVPDLNTVDVPTPTAVCGDSVVVSPETCDDGNTVPFDGCSSDCRKEPVCSGSGPCTSTCGDGIVLGEDCDDGNTADGDGCSPTCEVEIGWTCSQPPLGDRMQVPAVYRDFRYRNPSDFEAGVTGSEAASTGMVENSLDSEGKPVYTGKTGSAIHVESAATFKKWYRDDSSNHATPGVMTLWNNGKGAYVNRYGPKGEQWNVTETAHFCGSVGGEQTDSTTGEPIPCTSMYGDTDCDKAEAQGYTQLPGSCRAVSLNYEAKYIVQRMDGNPAFFPVDGDNFTPASERQGAKISPYYDIAATWPWEVDANGTKLLHNFSFTSEFHYWFKWDSANPLKLEFVGDNDLWVFINKKLVVDMGGIHTPTEDFITLDADTATRLGDLRSGNVYEIAVFHAERQTEGAALEITLPPFNMAPSECIPL